MVRKRKAEVHPALREEARGELARMDNEHLAALPGWEQFPQVWKKFLLMRAYFASDRECAEVVAPQETTWWVHKAMTESPQFKMAVERRRNALYSIIRHYTADMMAKSVLRLDRMLDAEVQVDAKTQLEAIKWLHRLNGLGEPEGATVKINAQNVISFTR
jgi:hypothetical protein